MEKQLAWNVSMKRLSDEARLRLFEAAAGKILILDPHNFDIVSVSGAYLQATKTLEQDIIGKNLFDVFPDIPGDPLADGTSNLLGSLKRVKSLKIPDVMGVQRYPIPLPDGQFEERYWSPVNTPVLDSSGNIEYIIHRVEDVTAYTRTRKDLTQAEQLLHLAREKVKLGGWRVELNPETIIWTSGTALIHETPAGYSPPSLDEAISFYSPEYRDSIRAALNNCVLTGTDFDVTCQLITANKKRLWARVIGVAERDDGGNTVAIQGAFQDITQLRVAEERADMAYQQRLDVLESISDAFFTLNKRWEFTYLNQQAEVVLERSRQTLLGTNVWHEFPEAVDSIFQHQYQYAMEHQKTVWFDTFYPPLNKWLTITAYPIPDGLAIYFRDVSGDRERQAQLRMIEAALERQNDMVIITKAAPLESPDGPIIVYVNDAFEKTTGYSRHEAIGRTPRFLQGADTDARQLNQISQALLDRKPVRVELINYTKAGKPYWSEIDIAPLVDNTGNCTHFVSVQRNINERKQQEADIRLNQERFRLISQATNDVIWDWDFESNEVWWNDSMYELFHYTHDELEPGPESWTRRIHPSDLERVEKSIHEVINGTKEHWREEYRFVKGDGKVATVIDRGFVIRTPSGKPWRMVGSMLDITDRMDLEKRLRESQKLEAIGHLTGGVAHDFNNLLTVIMGNSEELADRITDVKLKEMAEMTVSAAARGAELTNRLLAFARRQPLIPKPTNINQKIQAMGDLIRRTLPENIEFQFIGAPDLAITELDDNQLDTALLNLVVNARDAMPGGGKLIIETFNIQLDEEYASYHHDVVPGDYVLICVTDTGVGMDSDTVNRAIDPFFTTKGIGKGSGLGLSMVFGFTKQTRGHIKLYSEPGEGTAVKLYFPRSDVSLATDETPYTNPQLQGGSEYILVAEDDDLVREHIKEQLQSLGYRVTSVNSGPAALTALHRHPDIDLLLTDIIMPGGLNGRELADQALSQYPSLKVLYTSGYTENAIVHQGRLDPGVELLSKPYRRGELAFKVRKVLDTEN